MTLGNSYGLEIYCLVCIDKNRPQRIYVNKFQREREVERERERENFTYLQMQWEFHPIISKCHNEIAHD